jgi:hypothetical protein
MSLTFMVFCLPDVLACAKNAPPRFDRSLAMAMAIDSSHAHPHRKPERARSFARYNHGVPAFDRRGLRQRQDRFADPQTVTIQAYG